MVLPFTWQFGMSFIVFAVHARQQTPSLFQPGFISTTLWTRTLWSWFLCFSLHAACEQLETAFLSGA